MIDSTHTPLSPAGERRRDQILLNVLAASRLRKIRLWLGQMAMVAVAGIGLSWCVVSQWGTPIVAQRRAVTTAELQPITDSGPEPSPTRLHRLEHIDVEIIMPAQRTGELTSVTLETITDSELVRQFAEANLPFGLLETNGQTLLVSHTGVED